MQEGTTDVFVWGWITNTEVSLNLETSDASALLALKEKKHDYIDPCPSSTSYIKLYFEPVSGKMPACSSVTSMLVTPAASRCTSLSHTDLNGTLTILLDGPKQQWHKTFQNTPAAVSLV